MAIVRTIGSRVVTATFASRNATARMLLQISVYSRLRARPGGKRRKNGINSSGWGRAQGVGDETAGMAASYRRRRAATRRLRQAAAGGREPVKCFRDAGVAQWQSRSFPSL